MGKVIAIANQKGGVGKTTTAINLSAEFSQKGKRILIIDFDPQGNTSSGLGVYEDQIETTVYDVLIDHLDIFRSIYPTAVPNLHLIPSTRDLSGAEIELVSISEREKQLKKAIAPLKDNYDFIMIDCPPSLGLLTLNALVAADEVLIPVQCEYYALEGLSKLLDTIKLVQAQLNPQLEVGGILMTMFDKRTALSWQVLKDAQNHFKDQLYSTIIPRNVKLAEAPSFGEPVCVYDPGSKGAKSYRSLAKEIMYDKN